MQNVLDLEQQKIILVVDDTPENLELMGALLMDRYKVKIANNGPRALKIAMSEIPPDLILLDILMPDMDGYEVCRQLKANPNTCNIPVIFLSAKSEVDDERIGLQLGAVDFIHKPISPPIVLARITTHLLLKQAADIIRQCRANNFDPNIVDAFLKSTERCHETAPHSQVNESYGN
jgi:putative two-component system response regulator